MCVLAHNNNKCLYQTRRIMTPYRATIYALGEAAVNLDIDVNLNSILFRGGKDPGGWSTKGTLACVIHEGTDIPNEYNHRDSLSWWIALGDRVSTLCGKQVFFESVNSCVTNLYEA